MKWFNKRGNIMKRIIGYLLLGVVSIAIFCCIYIRMFKISIAFIVVFSLFFIVYATVLGFGWKSMEQLKKYEKKAVHFGLDKEDDHRILFYSLTTLSPLILCVFLVSLIPLYTYKVWLITVFPCLIINCLPAITVLDEYRSLTQKRFPFVVCYLFLVVVSCLGGTLVSSLLFK